MKTLILLASSDKIRDQGMGRTIEILLNHPISLLLFVRLGFAFKIIIKIFED
jgi:hypothetical protein